MSNTYTSVINCLYSTLNVERDFQRLLGSDFVENIVNIFSIGLGTVIPNENDKGGGGSEEDQQSVGADLVGEREEAELDEDLQQSLNNREDRGRLEQKASRHEFRRIETRYRADSQCGN